MVNNITFDYSKLRGKIVEKYGTQSAFAKAVGMSDGSLSLKLANKIAFTSDEIVAICELLGIPFEEVSDYFFNFKVEKTQQN